MPLGCSPTPPGCNPIRYLQAAILRLSGELDVIVNGNPVHRIKPGEIIGEMIVWFGGLRQATLKASTSGVIATLLMSESQQLPPMCTRLLTSALPARGCNPMHISR